MSENAHMVVIKRAIAELEFALIPDYYNDSSLENIASLNKKIEWHAEAMARELAEAEAQRDILRTHSEGMVPLYKDLERRLAEAEAMVGRLQEYASAELEPLLFHLNQMGESERDHIEGLRERYGRNLQPGDLLDAVGEE